MGPGLQVPPGTPAGDSREVTFLWCMSWCDFLSIRRLLGCTLASCLAAP